MQYIVCEKPGSLKIGQTDIPVRKKGQALLKIRQVGICGTDIHAYAGNQAFFTYPRILGHELAAEIVDIDHHPTLTIGDRVAVMPYISCGQCRACQKGKTNCCSSIQVLGVHTDGGMQEYFAVDVDLLLPANHLSLDQISIIEPLAIGAHALRRAQIQEGETVVVVGAGPIGLGIAKLAQLAGVSTVLMDINQQRLEFARDNMGLNKIVNTSRDPVQSLDDLTAGDLADVVFDATGHKGALEQGIKYMAHGGRYVLVGLSKGELVFKHPEIHAKETSILCSRNATLEDFEYVMDRLPLFPTQSFITHRCSLEEMPVQLDNWILPQSGVIKACIHF